MATYTSTRRAHTGSHSLTGTRLCLLHKADICSHGWEALGRDPELKGKSPYPRVANVSDPDEKLHTAARYPLTTLTTYIGTDLSIELPTVCVGTVLVGADVSQKVRYGDRARGFSDALLPKLVADVHVAF